MPTLQLMSDLHLEMHADGGHRFLESLDPTGVDVLALVGDILSARFLSNILEVLGRFAQKYPRVLYVPGNHEFWKTKPVETLALFQEVERQLPTVTVMYNKTVTIEGRRFHGGPMWFPAWGHGLDQEARGMPDFFFIANFWTWVIDENRNFKNFVNGAVKPNDIVLTHYLPSFASVSPQFQGSRLNAFFVCEMDRVIRQLRPALWLHGHTHDSCDYQLFDTRIVCNPFGYPTQLNPKYQEKLLIPF